MPHKVRENVWKEIYLLPGLLKSPCTRTHSVERCAAIDACTSLLEIIESFDRYSLSTYYVSTTVKSTVDTSVNQTDRMEFDYTIMEFILMSSLAMKEVRLEEYPGFFPLVSRTEPQDR